VGENTSQIEREIREKRVELGRNLEELGDKAREMVDWRTYYRDHSPLFLGAAFGLGLLCGLRMIPRAHPSHDGTIDLVDTSHDPWPHRSALTGRRDSTSRYRRQLNDTWDQIADGLLQTASDKAIEVVANLVPGFNERVDRRRRVS
jgi:hypothetical protein